MATSIPHIQLFDTQMVFLKESFEKVDFKKKKSTDNKKHGKFPRGQRVKLQAKPNKKISVFWVTGLKILGRVGTHIFHQILYMH